MRGIIGHGGSAYESYTKTRQEEAGEDGDQFDSVWIIVFLLVLGGALRVSIVILAFLCYLLGSSGGCFVGGPKE
jgi:hypothetical protein